MKKEVSIRKIVTILLTFTFCYLAIIGVVGETVLADIFKLVVVFYFVGKKRNGEK